MNNSKIKWFLVALILVSSEGLASESISCPKLSLSDLQDIGKDNVLKAQGHQWYLEASFKESDTATGSYLPIGLTFNEIQTAKTFSLDKEITNKLCQYKIKLSTHGITGYLQFRRIGE